MLLRRLLTVFFTIFIFLIYLLIFRDRLNKNDIRAIILTRLPASFSYSFFKSDLKHFFSK